MEFLPSCLVLLCCTVSSAAEGATSYRASENFVSGDGALEESVFENGRWASLWYVAWLLHVVRDFHSLLLVVLLLGERMGLERCWERCFGSSANVS